MAEYYVSRILREGRMKSPEAEKARETLTYLQSGIQKIAFSEEDIIEIKHLRDAKGLRSIQSRWGYKKDSRGKTKLRYPMDVFVTDVSREMPGMEHLADMHPAEAFLAINDVYESAKAAEKDKWISKSREEISSKLNIFRPCIEIVNKM